MTKRPLFSTYSQGENRVTGSTIAVFERLDLDRLEQIFEILTGESSTQLVSFAVVRPHGPGRVPDATIAANFKYLFEFKTEYDAVDVGQLRGHLRHLSGVVGADERLFVISPDAVEPQVIAELADERVQWFNFSQLSAAFDVALNREGVPEDERVLLRELQTLYSREGLLGREDCVVVAASSAYPFYLRRAAYVCQAGRAFRRDVTRLAFYRRLQIEPHVPLILARRDDVEFSPSNAERLRQTGSDEDGMLADLIRDSLETRERADGQVYQVFLLTAENDPRTFILSQPIVHQTHGRGTAFTMGQRYVNFADLETGPVTTADLGRAEGGASW